MKNIKMPNNIGLNHVIDFTTDFDKLIEYEEDIISHRVEVLFKDFRKKLSKYNEQEINIILNNLKQYCFTQLSIFLRYDFETSKNELLGNALGLDTDSADSTQQVNRTFNKQELNEYNTFVIKLYESNVLSIVELFIHLFIENNSLWLNAYIQSQSLINNNNTHLAITQGKEKIRNKLTSYEINLMRRIQEAKSDLRKSGEKYNCSQIHKKLMKPSYGTIKKFCTKHNISLE